MKDLNDVHLAGLSINSLKTEHIDKYCAREVLRQCGDDRELQYSKIDKYIRTVKSELIKADICTMLAKQWNQDLDVIKKQFSVKAENIEEKLSEFADVYTCLSTLDNVLDEEEIGIGYASIDANVTFRKKWVVILGAYSFSGKTSNLIEWILHWVIRLKKRVLFFSLEMPKEDVIEIIIAKLIGLPQYKVKETIKTPEGSRIYQDVAEKLQKYLYIVDKNNLSIDDVDEMIKVANAKVFDQPVDIVAVDYYQYLTNTTDYSDDSKTARKMKEIAKNNNISLVMLSQLNKQSQYKEKGKVSEPNQNHLKGAGDIGASADVIYMIWRPAVMDDGGIIESDENKYLTMLKVVKARKGLKHGISRFELVFDPNTSRIREKSRKLS